MKNPAATDENIDLSIIIPVANQDSPERLVQDLQSEFSRIGVSHEILIATPPEYSANFDLQDVEVITASRKSRAAQMNLAVARSKGKLLWFLHADSKIEDCGLQEVLPVAIAEPLPTCWYFNLSFENSTSKLCRINAAGANYRSKKWNLPFGDQGFLLKRELFESFGPFPEIYFSGEDHAFIQVLKKNKVRIRCTNRTIKTSPRKYSQHGWLKTTLQHLYLTALQEYKFKSDV